MSRSIFLPVTLEMRKIGITSYDDVILWVKGYVLRRGLRVTSNVLHMEFCQGRIFLILLLCVELIIITLFCPFCPDELSQLSVVI